jgi:aspartyl-tRNA(Asn)/glutamyl-tRNA(Gln) amidotransferase subunit A
VGWRASRRTAIERLAALGADVVDVDLPDHEALMAGISGTGADALAYHGRWLRTRLQDYGEDLQVRLLAAQLVTAEDYARGLRARRLLKVRYATALAAVDLIVGPTTPIVAPTIEESRDTFKLQVLSRNTRPSNTTGLPAISLPCGFVSGLPVGLQLIGHAFGEETLLRAAAAYEAATDWHEARPAIATN